MSQNFELISEVFGVADQNTLTVPFRQDVLRISLSLGPLLFALPADAETRLSLITTNAAYPSETGPLTNPHRDGEVIATGLQAVGFEKSNIVVVKDADQPTLRMAVADFVERIGKVGADAVSFSTIPAAAHRSA